MDILFFAILAAYFVYKFYLTLGEERSVNQQEDSHGLSRSSKIKDVTINKSHESLSDEEKIKLIDKSFNLNSFLNNSEKAIKLVFQSLTEGNTAILSDLSEMDVLKRFAFIISEIEEKKLQANISDLNLKKTKLEKAIIHENFAELSVKYQAEAQISLFDNKILIAGNKNKFHKFNLEASFAKNLKSKDPTWKLSKINFIPFEKEINV